MSDAHTPVPGGNGQVPAVLTGHEPAGDAGGAEMLVGGYEKRRPVVMWVRVRLLLLLLALWWIFFWYALNDPLMSVHDGLVQTWDSKWWLTALFVLEALRQVNYLVAEHWGWWAHTWSQTILRGTSRKFHMSDWGRYRAKRLIAIAAVIALVAVIAGAAQHENPVAGLFSLPSQLVSVLGYLAYILFAVGAIVLQFVAMYWFLSRGGVDIYFPDDIKTRFSHVWGQDAVLQRVKESILFLEDPGSIEGKGGYVPGGILLWGPPGTGKTLMAEAVAGETGKPFVFVDPGAFINMFVGIGPMKVRSLFRKVRRLAVRYGGVIVFFDEADSLGSRGALAGLPGGTFRNGTSPSGAPGPGSGPWAESACHGGAYLSQNALSVLIQSQPSTAGPAAAPAAHGRGRIVDGGMIMGGGGGGMGGMGTLQSLLTEMSGLSKPRGFMNRVIRRALGIKPVPPPKYRILIMMATNMPDSLDPALLRPGRIDRVYKVGYPSKAGRLQTYKGYLAKVPHELTDEQVDRLATMTPYATGATIKDLVNESLIVSIRNGRERVAWADVLEAKRLRDLGLPEDVEYVERERHSVAIHEACHAVVAHRVRTHAEIDVATIEKGGSYLGLVSSIRAEDRFTTWRSEYESDVLVSLASLAGERRFFQGDSSSGVQGDLESATGIMALMEGYWGMGDTVMSYSGRGREASGSDFLRGEVRDKVEQRLRDFLAKVDSLLESNKLAIFALAHALEMHKSLSGEDVEAVIEGRQGPSVDGRVYHLPGFLEAYSAYHDQLLAAHIAGEKRPMASLPGTSVWAPDLVGVGSGSANGIGS
ncbi:MAG TPA: AAA family ATPase [Acidimicrobiales bacterium]|nr:AAA family ATPase [Acidimicrobiales bacterium]